MALRGNTGTVMSLAGITDVDVAVTWLTAANAVVNQRLAGKALSALILTRIEEHLAAHYIELGGGKVATSERLPDWSATYAAGAKLDDLRSTRNGFIAAQLDTTGSLLEASKPTPRFAVM